MRKNLEGALAEALPMAERADVTLLLEPLNTRVDHPGYYLDSSAEAMEIVRSLNNRHLKVLYDIYHMQIMEGNILATIEANISWIGHFHAAGVPGRGELFGCELDYPSIVAKIDSLGYDGAFGLEYFPKWADHGESLRKTLEHLAVASTR
jgi:hydroxypyruvate isomerase